MTVLSRLPGLIHAWVPLWLQALLVFAAIVVCGAIVQHFVISFLTARARNWPPVLHGIFVRTRRLFRYAIVLLALVIAIPLIPLSHQTDAMVHHIVIALFIVLIGWIVGIGVNAALDRYEKGLKLDSSDNLLARKAATQTRILRQAANVLVGMLTLAFALMNFEAVRQFGISLFASAGIAGIVAGLAARPMLENLIAGVQLALTQPVRLDDAVVIDNEWGWVEEINSVYIVVRLWDWRRQIVPLSYLFQNPFTNWTRSSSSIIGTVMLYLDYTTPVGQLRTKAAEIAKASPLWDGQVVNVQVSDTRETTMEVRILISAGSSSKAWDLRCEMREKLIDFVRENYPASLPRTRREDFRLAAGASQGGSAGPVPR